MAYKPPKEIAKAGIVTGSTKSKLSWDKALVAGFLAGAYIAYTGVLLASTAVPLWNRSRALLPPIFMCTAAAGEAAANRLILAATGTPAGNLAMQALASPCASRAAAAAAGPATSRARSSCWPGSATGSRGWPPGGRPPTMTRLWQPRHAGHGDVSAVAVG